METNCPNCGAPIKHYYNHNCEYCGTLIYNTSEQIKAFKNCSLRNVRVSIDENPCSISFIISIKGTTVPKMFYLEEIDAGSMITSSENLGKLVGIRIKIPFSDFMNYKYDELNCRILKSLPDPFKEHYHEIISQIIDLTCKKRISARWLIK